MDARERNDNKNVSFLFLSDSRCPAYTVMLCQEHPQKQTSSFFLFGSNFATRRANELSPTRRLVKRKRDLLEGRIAPHSLHHFFLLLLRISVSGITHTQISIFLFVFRWFSPNKQKGGTLWEQNVGCRHLFRQTCVISKRTSSFSFLSGVATLAQNRLTRVQSLLSRKPAPHSSPQPKEREKKRILLLFSFFFALGDWIFATATKICTERCFRSAHAQRTSAEFSFHICLCVGVCVWCTLWKKKEISFSPQRRTPHTHTHTHTHKKRQKTKDKKLPCDPLHAKQSHIIFGFCCVFFFGLCFVALAAHSEGLLLLLFFFVQQPKSINILFFFVSRWLWRHPFWEVHASAGELLHDSWADSNLHGHRPAITSRQHPFWDLTWANTVTRKMCFRFIPRRQYCLPVVAHLEPHRRFW